MKSLKKTLIAIYSILLLLTGLTSCGNLLLKADKPEPNSSLSTMTGTLKGTVTTTGAIPSSLASSSGNSAKSATGNDRTAYPDENFNAESYTWHVQATTEGETIEVSVNSGTYTISGLKYGTTYTIEAYVTFTDNDNSEKTVLKGQYKEGITLDSKVPNLDLSESPIQLHAIMEGSGSIKLPITSKCNKITRAHIWFDDSNINDYNQILSFEYTEDPQEDTKYYFLPEVGSGLHTITIEFWETIDVDGNSYNKLVYWCKEAVNVFSNLETDTWISDSTQVSYLKTKDGTTSFIVDSDCLSEFADPTNTLFVDSNIGKTDNRGTFTNPYNNLFDAINIANEFGSDDVRILVKNNSNAECTFPITLKKNLIIQTYSDINSTSTRIGSAELKLKSSSPMITVPAGKTLTLNGISFTNGTDSPGTYIDIEEDAKVELTRCSFDDGNVSSEGAICNNGTLTLAGCSFSHDTANDDESPNDVYCGAASTTKLGAGNTFSGVIGLAYDEAADKLAVVYIEETFSENDAVKLALVNYDKFLLRKIVSYSQEANYSHITPGDDKNYKINNQGILRANVLEGYYVDTNSQFEGTPDGSYEMPYTSIYDVLRNSLSINSETNIYIKDQSNDYSWVAESGNKQIKNNVNVSVWKDKPGDGLGTATIHPKGSLNMSSSSSSNPTISFSGIVFDASDLSGFSRILFFDGNIEPKFTNCVFKKQGSDNELIHVSYGHLYLTNCTFTENNSSSCTIQLQGADLTLSGSTYFDASSSIGVAETEDNKSGRFSSIDYKDLQLPDEANGVCATLKKLFISPGDSLFVNDYDKELFPVSDERYYISDGTDGKKKGTLYFKEDSGLSMPQGIYVNTFSTYEGVGDGSFDNPYKSLYQVLFARQGTEEDCTIYVRKGSSDTFISRLEFTGNKSINLKPWGWSNEEPISDKSLYKTITVTYECDDPGISVTNGSLTIQCFLLKATNYKYTDKFIDIANAASVELSKTQINGIKIQDSVIYNAGTLTSKSNSILNAKIVDLDGNTLSNVYACDIHCSPESLTDIEDTYIDKYVMLEYDSNTRKQAMLTMNGSTDSNIKVLLKDYDNAGQILKGNQVNTLYKNINLIQPEQSDNYYTIDDTGTVARTLYVSSIGSFDSQGTESVRFETLSEALEKIGDNVLTRIYVKPGETNTLSTDLTDLTLENKIISLVTDSNENNSSVSMEEGLILDSNTSFSAKNISFSSGDGTKESSLFRINGNATFDTCSFSGTRAGQAVIFNNSGNLTLKSCTFANRETPNENALIFSNGKLSLDGSFTWGNNEYMEVASQNDTTPIISLEDGFTKKQSDKIKLKIEDFINLNGKQVFAGSKKEQASSNFSPYPQNNFSIGEDGKIHSHSANVTITIQSLYDNLTVECTPSDNLYSFNFKDPKTNDQIDVDNISFTAEHLGEDVTEQLHNQGDYAITLSDSAEKGYYHIYLSFNLNNQTYYADFFVEKK